VASKPSSLLDNVVSLCKRRGFVFPSGEIYGGTRSAWDYGPLGVELKENLKRQWWRSMVTARDDVVGLDSSVILPKRTWEASGHVSTFTDPLTECQSCHKRFRADHMQEAYAAKRAAKGEEVDPDSVDLKELACPNCGTRGAWTEPRQFNMMLKTYLGVIEDESGLHYLRPETAQGIFLNFVNVMNSSRKKPPFGIAQQGKSFRNEITPGNFIFRTREFEQMEMEYFVAPDAEHWKLVDYWVEQYLDWFQSLGVNRDNLYLYEVPEKDLAHYSKRTVDIMYRYFPEREKPWEELMGIAWRTDFDLSVHSKNKLDAEGKRLNPDSTEDLSYFDEATKTRFYPHVIEPAAGVNRTVLAVLMDAYSERTNDKGETRVILKLAPQLAPIKAAILPLAKNKPEIVGMAKAIKRSLQPTLRAVYDDTGGIGKLYARQDEIGTPLCVTVDHQSLEDEAVTVRDRDTWEQERVKVSELPEHLQRRLQV